MPHSPFYNQLCITYGVQDTTVIMEPETQPESSICYSTGRKMTRQEFMNWLKKYDSNDDGKISKHELRDALKALGLSGTTWKVWRAMIHADLNKNKLIDGDLEIAVLVNYAAKKWRITEDK